MKLGFIATAISVIIAIVIVMSILGSTGDTINDASDEIGHMNNCSETGAGYRYDTDISTVNCTNSSDMESGAVAGFYSLPLQSLFRNNGVVLLVLMAAFVIGIIAIARKLR